MATREVLDKFVEHSVRTSSRCAREGAPRSTDKSILTHSRPNRQSDSGRRCPVMSGGGTSSTSASRAAYRGSPLHGTCATSATTTSSCCSGSGAKSALFPYHLGEYVCRVLRVTPFAFYCDILVDSMKADSAYDTIPNFTGRGYRQRGRRLAKRVHIHHERGEVEGALAREQGGSCVIYSRMRHGTADPGTHPARTFASSTLGRSSTGQ